MNHQALLVLHEPSLRERRRERHDLHLDRRYRQFVRWKTTNAWKDFLNFEMMKTQFRAIASFDSGDRSRRRSGMATDQHRSVTADAPAFTMRFLRSITIPEEGHREKRWKWLCDRTVIRHTEPCARRSSNISMPKRISTRQANIVLRDIGVTDGEHPADHDSRLDGRSCGNCASSTGASCGRSRMPRLTVLLYNLADRKPGRSSSKERGVRYFGARAQLPKLAEDCDRYDSASAFPRTHLTRLPLRRSHEPGLLGGASPPQGDPGRPGSTPMPPDWAIATAYLGNQGFRVIRPAGIHAYPSISRRLNTSATCTVDQLNATTLLVIFHSWRLA